MPAKMPHGQTIERINLMILTDSGLKEVGNLSFSEKDESLYFRLEAPTAHYVYGKETIPAGQTDLTFSYTDRPESTTTPAKLSIHATGQTHVKLDVEGSPAVAGPVFGPPLSAMRDHHIASIAFDDFAALRAVTRSTTTQGTNVDFGFPFGANLSGRIVIWANAYEPEFRDTDFFIHLAPMHGQPLHIGFAGSPNEPLGPDSGSGFTLIAGWDPHRAPQIEEPQDLVWIRCM